MKKYFLLLFTVPVLGYAQVKRGSVKKSRAASTLSKPTSKVPSKKLEITKAVDGFLINGNISGYPEGTPVSLINANTGAVELTSKTSMGKFSFSGKIQDPEFKVIALGEKAPYITIFLDNSLITVTGSKTDLEKSVVKGSTSNDEYVQFSTLVKPYEKVFSGEATLDSAETLKLNSALTRFIQQNPQSHISPLAIYRQYQLVMDNVLMEKLYNGLSISSQHSAIGGFVSKQIAENKKNPIGQPLADFTQPDTSGHTVALSSLKGKYVLVDFWASWCGPCRQENPNVLNVYNKYKEKNFTVLGVSLDKTKKAWVDAINMDALTWNHVSDLQGWNNAVAQKFEIFSIPQNFLLDPNGKIIAKNLRGPALESKLNSLLK